LEDSECSSKPKMKDKQVTTITELGSWEELPGSYRVQVRDGIQNGSKISTNGYHDAADCL